MASDFAKFFEDLVHDSSLTLNGKALFITWANHAKSQLKTSSDRKALLALLDRIPYHPNSEYLRLAALAFCLCQYSGKHLAFDVIQYRLKLWKGLPENIKACQNENANESLKRIDQQVALSIGDLPSLFDPDSISPAIFEPTSQQSLSHRDLSVFIQNFRLPISVHRHNNKPIVAIALPNGALLGVATMAVTSYYTAAPINILGGSTQFRSDVELARPQCILAFESDVYRLGLTESWVQLAGIQVILVHQNENLTFWVDCPVDTCSPTPNTSNDLALILFTSGTSGTKKVVPITLFGLLTGVGCVIDSWGLGKEDCCLNMMPLNHIGGLVRNLFAPILSGGSTVLCQAFDPNMFWDILEDGKGTWYYASPSMHMSILEEGRMRGDSVSGCSLRLVCNAAGGLLPALAVQLRNAFKCTILPSYGMTECMPISTPPLEYTLDRVGTSGISCGPEIAIFDALGNQLPPRKTGQINVRGSPVFPGYLKDGKIDTSCFSTDGWFDTGDLGFLDQDGYLYLTGRGKEVINRGGEIISPFEVEEAITICSQDSNSILFGRVQQVMAFSAPHEVLQEVVGVVLVTKPGQPRPDVRDLQTALESQLHPSKVPIVIVYLDALPTSNNKLVRIRFSERMDMIPMKNEMKLVERHFHGRCPPVNSSLDTKIVASTCSPDSSVVLGHVEEHLDSDVEAHVGENHHDGTPIVYLAPMKAISNFRISKETIETIRESLRMSLDGFLLPSRIRVLDQPFPRDVSDAVDEEQLGIIIKNMNGSSSPTSASETEHKVRRAFGEVLRLDVSEISSSSDFFQLGGDSMSAGRLSSVFRRDLKVRIPVDQLFSSRRVDELCKIIDALLKTNFDHEAKPREMIGCTETCSSTNPLVMFIHLLPIAVLYPTKMGFHWTAFMYFLTIIANYWDEPNVPSRFLALISAMFLSRVATQIVAPICGIALKWLIIGKYREGMYPMWGVYHTRWWLVDKILLVCGKVGLRNL